MVKGKRQLGVNTQTGELKIIREGKDNIELIFNFIFDNRSTGARPRDIKKNTGLSKQTVNKHLQLLFKEKRIYKKDKKVLFRYFHSK